MTQMPMSSGATDTTGEREYAVGMLTRVEGEGSLTLRVTDGEVVEAKLGIFEAPRYFERLVVGRTPDEVIDIVARICGICPVAYQMSAVHSFESLFGVADRPAIRMLRRLFYCGEWIESHALHVYMLHAPDFLGYPSAIELARDHRDIVERALVLKRTGNKLVALLGARPDSPTDCARRWLLTCPQRGRSCLAVRSALDEALAIAASDCRVRASLNAPVFEREPRLVSLRHPDEYPMNDGRIVSNDGLDIAIGAWRDAFAEDQVAWSNALQARTHAGEVYLLGPSARIDPQCRPAASAGRCRTCCPGLAEQIRMEPVLEHRRASNRAGARRWPRRSTSSMATSRPIAHTRPWMPRAGGDRLGDGGAARSALPPLRDRR